MHTLARSLDCTLAYDQHEQLPRLIAPTQHNATLLLQQQQRQPD
jgi:hypothetical protein